MALAARIAAVVMRVDGASAVFRAGSGDVALVAERGWALAGPRAGTPLACNSMAGFAGIVRRRDMPDIAAALRHVGADRVAVSTVPAAGFAIPWTGRWNAVPLAVAAENVRRMAEWGVPPPAPIGSALRAYAGAPVRDPPWEPPACTNTAAGRGDPIEAIREWSGWFPATYAMDEDGRAWELRRIEDRVIGTVRGIEAVAFPAPGVACTEPAPSVFLISPRRDIAIAMHRIRDGPAFPGRGALPIPYAELPRVLRGETSRIPPVRAAALAVTLAAARMRTIGSTLVLEGAHVVVPHPVDLQPQLA